MTYRTGLNEQARQTAERIVRVDKRMSAAIQAHPTAVRFQVAEWERGYETTMWTDVTVYDANGERVYFGDIQGFIERSVSL